MNGILVLAHGSREKETELTMQSVIDQTKRKLGVDRIEFAFLQFSENNLQAGLSRLISQGVKDIKVIPYFLFAGIHIKEDIPKEIGDFLKGYPGVRITMGNTLGADERLAEILADRVRELM
jgi:sirohydrochlorin ferrochelatase